MPSWNRHDVDTVVYHLKQGVMEAATAGHLAGGLPAAAAQPQLQVALRQEELQRVSRVRFKGAGVGGCQVERCESSVGLGIEGGAVPQEEARHGHAAPAAGAVKGRPPIDGLRVNL